MTDQGYMVFWDVTDENTGEAIRLRRKFATKSGADQFRGGLIAYGDEPLPVRESASTADATRDEQNRQNTDVLNRRALVELMLEHGITLNARDFDKWRPTVEKTGRIDGVSDGLTCIMTDGLLAYFLREGRKPLIGHVEWFKWDIPDISYIPYYDEHGQKKFFKQVKEQGAPAPLFKRPPKLVGASYSNGGGTPKVRKKAEPMTTASALRLIEEMTLKMKGGEKK